MNLDERAPLKKPVFIFLHIPKTGGITLSEIVTQNFESEQIFHIRNPNVAKAPRFSSNCGTCADFAALPESERASFDCVVGHVTFGIHEKIDRPCVYATLLRDPVDRVLSQHGQFNRMVLGGEFPEEETVDLEGFFEIRPNSVENQQARFLNGSQFASLSNEERLIRAQENLRKHFVLVGTLERFDESLLLLNHRMGWPTRPYEVRNVGQNRSQVTDLSQETLEKIRNRTRLDKALFELADQMLSEGIRGIPGFQKELRRFQKVNRSAPGAVPPRTDLVGFLRRVKCALGRRLSR